MKSIEIRSSIKDGKITRNRNLFIDALKAFSENEVIITIRKATKKRSNPQNSFYHGVVIPIMQNCLKEAGYLMNNEKVHELLKLRFLKESILVNEETGEFIERVKSTTELSTVQMMEYIQDIQKFAAEYFNTVIPDPSTVTTLNFDI